MHALNNTRKPLPKQWFQSALLHGALLLSAIWYHLHSHGSLHFSGKSVDEVGTLTLAIPSEYHRDFIELSLEQYDSTGSPETHAKPAEESSDALIEAPMDSLLDIPLDLMIDAPPDSLIDTPLDVQIETPIGTPTERSIATPKNELKETSVGLATVAKKNKTAKFAKAKVKAKETETAKETGRIFTAPEARALPLSRRVAAHPLQAARPDYAHNPKPAYPLALRDLGISGVVRLRVWVDETGLPREIELVEGSGYRLFDEAALRAVRHWRFIPAKNAQQSLASWVEFAVRFEING